MILRLFKSILDGYNDWPPWIWTDPRPELYRIKHGAKVYQFTIDETEW